MQRHAVAGLFCALLVTANAGCATKSIVFKTDGKATVTAVSPANLDQDGKVLGETPLTLELATLEGQIVKIAQPGKVSQYWVVSPSAGEVTEVALKLKDDPQSATAAATPGALPANDPKATTNRMMRLLMRAYQALAERKYPLASELADKAAQIDPEIAAPHVIKGIALMQQGDKGSAKGALSKAKALDPEDTDLDRLLQVVE